MSQAKSSCNYVSDSRHTQSVSHQLPAPKRREGIKRCIAVMSGKGGVGKSLVTALMAVSLVRSSYKVGVLDADITGPSIPKIFGLKANPETASDKLLPIESRTGIKVISINLLLRDEGDAVIWRGPLIGNAVKQFWEEASWGKLDYLLIDLPPGTSDAPLTVMQSIPLDGIVVVASPQDLAVMIVKKAIHMAQKMNIPILGLIENMSYAVCPSCSERLEPFGASRAEKVASSIGIRLAGRLPIDPEISRLCDEGEIEKYHNEFFEQAVQTIIGLSKKKNN